MKKISYYLAFFILAGGAISAYWAYGRYIKKDEPQAIFLRVERGSINEMVKVRGEAVSQKEFDLEFLFTGTVERIFKKESDMVSKGELLMKLDTRDFELEINELEAKLNQSQASLAKLLAGATKEDINVLETQVKNAEKSFEDEKNSLNNVKEKAEIDLKNSYDDALAAAQKSASLGKTALLTLSDIQVSYFMGSDQNSAVVESAKSFAVYDMIGAINAGRYSAEVLNKFIGGAYGKTQAALSDPINENIDEALKNLVLGLQSVKNALNAVPVIEKISATDKTNLNIEKDNINTEIITISTKSRAIKSQKITNESNVSLAVAKVNSAESALNLAVSNLSFKKAGARQEDIKIAESQIVEIKSQIAKIQEKIRKSYISAPVSAKITKIWLENYELAQPGQIAISLSSNGYKIRADISELEIGKTREALGNDVLIKFDSFPDEEFKGKIISVEPKEIIKDGDKYFRADIYFENNGKEIRSGMSADLKISIISKTGALKIPEFSVYQKDGKNFVKIKEGEQEKEVGIKIGISDGEYVEITEGLREGDTVVVRED